MNNWRVRGIKVRIHPLFWLVAVAGAMTGQFLELITLFILVIIHELGHVFAALAVGWRVVSIELLPFGGVAKVDEWGSTKARDEVLVALAGPFVNGCMVAVSYLLLWAGVWDAEWFDFFVTGNLFIACFNLLPIWPLDGGKVLQALLAKWLPFYRIIYLTIIWSCISLAILMSISVLFSFKWNLLVICLYLLVENKIAWKRGQYQFIRFLLMKKEQRPITAYPLVTYTVPLHVSVGYTVKLLRKEANHCFQVLDRQKKVIAVLPEETILSAFFEKNPRQTISELLPFG